MIKKIELVTTKEGSIQIYSVRSSSTGEDEYYLLGNGNALLCNDSNQRLSTCSELGQRLRVRDWHVAGRRITYPLGDNWLDSSVDMYFSEYGTSGKSVEVSKDLEKTRLHFPNVKNRNLLEELIKNLDGLALEIYKEMEDQDIYRYSRPKNIVNVLENSIVIDVIPYSSDVYTNTVDIGKLIGYAVSPGISTKIDIGVQYSKNVPEEIIDQETGIVTEINYVEKLYSKESSFFGFKYVSGDNGIPVLVNNSYVEDVGGDVVIEYADSVIRAIPKSNDVDECIISSCTVTYGKL